MAFSGSSLEQALTALGEVLESRGHEYRLADRFWDVLPGNQQVLGRFSETS